MKFSGVALAALLLTATPLYPADHAVILLYHHVSTDTPSSTSVSPEVFGRHLNYLDRQGYHVLPLSRVLRTLTKGEELPAKTVCITFDDAYRSVLDTAMPLLREKEFPFTVFVNTGAIAGNYAHSLDWDGLKQLVAGGAEIGNHSHDHDHLARRLENESEAQWRKRVHDNIAQAAQLLATGLKSTVNLFAYPFGEHTPELREIVASLGYYGIAQQSGAAGRNSDMLAIPRFPMTTSHADMNRFITSVNSRPLPVRDVSAGPAIQTAGENSRYKLSFTLVPGGYRAAGLACYDSSGQMLESVKEKTGETERISVQLPDWNAGRRKINCTAPSSGENGVYYWYSHLWLVKHADGGWYSE